ncbi:MAG: protein jag [Firmicutes bacterium]|nr:protein jag [Bacillota bacterium]
MDAIEKWGVSVEEAVDLALQEMKLSRDDVEVTVLEEPSRGFFGIGSKLAKVRVERKAPVIEEKPEEVKEAPARKPGPIGKEEVRPEELVTPKDRQDRKPRERKDRDRKKKPRKEKRETVNIALDGIDKESLEITEDHEALTFLKEVTAKMGLKLDFTCRTGENLVYIEMSGDDSRTVIGKRGQTLDAIQYLTSLVVNKDNKAYIKVVIDAENYRAKRQRTLEQLADRLAGKVVKTGKQVRLEPMNPYERKVIHATLQSHPSVITRSEGEEPYRRVIIELKK